MTEDDIRTELYRLRYQQKLLEMQANRLPDDNVIQELANIKTEIKNIKKDMHR